MHFLEKASPVEKYVFDLFFRASSWDPRGPALIHKHTSAGLKVLDPCLFVSSLPPIQDQPLATKLQSNTSLFASVRPFACPGKP